MTNNSFSIETGIKFQIKHIRKCCYMLLKRREEADLLESEVLEKIWTKKHLFNGTENDFKGWAFTIARNIAITNYRKRKYRIENIEVAQTGNHSAFIVNHTYHNKQYLRDVVYTIKSKFKEQQAEIFRLHVIEGYKIFEVAEQLDVPDGTVKHVVHSIRKYISNPKNIISDITKQVA